MDATGLTGLGASFRAGRGAASLGLQVLAGAAGPLSLAQLLGRERSRWGVLGGRAWIRSASLSDLNLQYKHLCKRRGSYSHSYSKFLIKLEVRFFFPRCWTQRYPFFLPKDRPHLRAWKKSDMTPDETPCKPSWHLWWQRPSPKASVTLSDQREALWGLRLGLFTLGCPDYPANIPHTAKREPKPASISLSGAAIVIQMNKTQMSDSTFAGVSLLSNIEKSFLLFLK